MDNITDTLDTPINQTSILVSLARIDENVKSTKVDLTNLATALRQQSTDLNSKVDLSNASFLKQFAEYDSRLRKVEDIGIQYPASNLVSEFRTLQKQVADISDQMGTGQAVRKTYFSLANKLWLVIAAISVAIASSFLTSIINLHLK